jgi:hypothetical protein
MVLHDVASVYSKCFICFLDVCCKYVYLDVAYISHICYKCVYLDVAYVFNSFFKCFHVFLQVYETHVSRVSYVFISMLQMFHLDIRK